MPRRSKNRSDFAESVYANAANSMLDEKDDFSPCDGTVNNNGANYIAQAIFQPLYGAYVTIITNTSARRSNLNFAEA